MSTEASRVVVAVRAGSDVHFLGEAGALARTLHVELAALFVEEIELVRLARLPFVREIGVASGAVREIDAESVARLHRQQADLIRAQVASIAHRMELPWSFDTARGSLLDVALGVISSGDLLMLEPVPSAVQHALSGLSSRAARTTLPQGAVTGTSVAVLYEQSPAGDRAFEVALGLAGGRPESVTIVVDQLSDAQRARRAASESMGLPAGLPSVVTMAQLVGGVCPRALVVPLDRFASAPAALHSLRTTARCPLVLVR